MYNRNMPDDARLCLNLARLVPVTEAEGPGRRFAVWLQGCPLRCPGCCNPEMLSLAGGESQTVAEIGEEIELAFGQGIEGLTLLGGEPFAQAVPAAALARLAHGRDLSVLIFSGFTLEQLRNSPEAGTADLLAETDILVDGPYRREQPETRRRWIGSANQRIHFLTDRCRADDPRWSQANTLELRLRGRELTVNGFPARRALGLWRRPSVSGGGACRNR